jgi:hypothetical protein
MDDAALLQASGPQFDLPVRFSLPDPSSDYTDAQHQKSLSR